MAEYLSNIPTIKYEGSLSKNPLAFKFYDPDKVIMGKKMSEHLPFAMAWWHNLCAAGTDMFGRDTADKSFGAQKGTMAHAKAKVDAGFEFMQKLGIRYFCFHDVDIVPEADDIKETNRRLDEISDYILEKMGETGIKCLWGTANMFSNPRFMNGAGSSNSADVFLLCGGVSVLRDLSNAFHRSRTASGRGIGCPVSPCGVRKRSSRMPYTARRAAAKSPGV